MFLGGSLRHVVLCLLACLLADVFMESWLPGQSCERRAVVGCVVKIAGNDSGNSGGTLLCECVAARLPVRLSAIPSMCGVVGVA